MLVAKAEAPKAAPTASPPGGIACPEDMRLVERDHYEAIGRACTDMRDGKHCFAYQPGSNHPIGDAQHLRFCMDPFEAPNVRFGKPLVMQSAVDGEAWCGARARCGTSDGIYDLVGNVEEWVQSRASRRWPETLIGGFWAKPWTGCRGANDAHETTFRFYKTGFRCCADAK